MRVHSKEKFGDCGNMATRTFSDTLYDRCQFESISLLASVSDNLSDRTRVQNVRLDRCSVVGSDCFVECAVLDGVRVSLRGPIRVFFCGLRHVALVGQFRDLNLSSSIPAPTRISDAFLAECLEENHALHDEADWIVDVGEARFGGKTIIRDIPPEKIRIDPKRQAIITKASMRNAADVFDETHLVGVVGQQIRSALRGGPVIDPIVSVLVESKVVEEELEMIRLLHQNGLALPVNRTGSAQA